MRYLGREVFLLRDSTTVTRHSATVSLLPAARTQAMMVLIAGELEFCHGVFKHLGPTEGGQRLGIAGSLPLP